MNCGEDIVQLPHTLLLARFSETLSLDSTQEKPPYCLKLLLMASIKSL